MSARRALPARLFSQAPRLAWRVHAAGHGATEFYAGGKGGARFSPLYSASAECVPTLYLASSFDAALLETVFREVPTPPQDYILDVQRLADAELVASCIRLTRRMKLVDLTSKGLKRLGLTRREVIDTSVLEYPRTRSLSQRLHDTTDAQGLYWTSKQDDEARAFLLYGDRIPPGSLRSEGRPMPLWEDPPLSKMLNLAERIGITKVSFE